MSDSPANETVTLTIDGVPVTVPKGTKVIEAAKQIGKVIPHFCYHPGLPVDGNCRMCIADVRTWNPRSSTHVPARRPAVTCWTDAEENMLVLTETDEVRKARASVMEFLLVNHPIDCPICDKAGECMLQDYYMQHDRKRSELRDDKVHKPRLRKFGERIVYNGERCILCSRCTRFTEHVSKTYDLGIVNRGDRAIVELAEGSKFDNPYTDNVADVCPVGALTKTDFRFKRRVWFLKHTESVCAGCSRGCNTVIDHDRTEIVRIMPRRNDAVNGHWMCNEGRDLYKEIGDGTRVSGPMPRMPDGGASWPSVLEFVGKRLADQKKAPKVAAIGSSFMSNEEAFLLASLVGKALKSDWMDVKQDRLKGRYGKDEVLHTDDPNPNLRGAREAGLVPGKKDGKDLPAILEACRNGDVDLLIVWGTGLDLHTTGGLRETLSPVRTILQITDTADTLSGIAHVVLPVTNWAERDGTFTNIDGKLGRFKKALVPPKDTMDGFALLLALAQSVGVKPAADTIAAARKALKQDPNSDVHEVEDGKFSFGKKQALYRHVGGVAEV